MKKYIAYIIIFAVVILSLFFYINSGGLIDRNKTEDVGIRYYNDLYKAEVLLPADWKMVVSEYDGQLGPIESNDWDYVVFVGEELKTEVSFHYHDNEKTSWSNEDVFAAALDLFNVYERTDYEIVDIKISGFDAKKIYETNSVGDRVLSLVIINTNEGILKVSLDGNQDEINRIVDSIIFKSDNSVIQVSCYERGNDIKALGFDEYYLNKDWITYKTNSGFTFQYPNNKIQLNDLNIEEDGEGSFIFQLPPSGVGDGPFRLASIEINKTLPLDEGWTSEEYFNNQNSLGKQIERLQKKSSKILNYYPCPLDENEKTVVQDGSDIHVFMKKGDYYLHARYSDLSAVRSDIGLSVEEEESVKDILRSIK